MQYLFLIHHNLCLFTLHTYCDKKSIKGVNCNVNVTPVLCTVSREPSHKNINNTNFLSVLCSSLGPSLSLSSLAFLLSALVKICNLPLCISSWLIVSTLPASKIALRLATRDPRAFAPASNRGK